MSWLTRMDIDARIAYAERIFESYAWHQRVWQCFPGRTSAHRDFLTRIDTLEGAWRVWILSRTKPVCPPWCPSEIFAVKEISSAFLSHRYYAFDLRANPVRSLVQRNAEGGAKLRPDGKRERGKRVPLVRPDDLRQWLSRKGEVRCRDSSTGEPVAGGFAIVANTPLEISPMVASPFRKTELEHGYHAGVQFRGVLQVTNRECFIGTYESGVGGGKSFGFGLFLLAPVSLPESEN